MKKGVLVFIIIVLVLVELLTLGFYNESKNENDVLQAKIEALNEEITNYRQQLSTKPEDIFACVKEAYVNKDAEEIVRLYRKFENLPVINTDIEEKIIDYVKTLNRQVDNKELKSVVADISKKEAATQKWKSSKEYKEQQDNLNRILNQAVQVGNKESELKRKYGDRKVEIARSGKVQIGWTKELCEFAWGKPTKKSTYASSNGTTEYWHYDKKGSLNTLMFIDGVLESVSKSDK